MKGKENKHVKSFLKAKIKPSENIISHLEGWIGEMMGKGDKTQYNGQFILTNMRICFHRKGMLGEVFETIPINKITSVETKSCMGYRVLRIHTSHDDLAFKTFESKELFEQTYNKLESLRETPDRTSISTKQTESIPDKIKQLAELFSSGIISENEFNTKKAELLSKM